MQYRVLCFLLMVSVFSANAQNRALGTWHMYLPYNSSVTACDAGDKVYSAAAKSVFSYDKQSGTIQIYDKASGLSDVGISTIAYDATGKVLAIAYVNSNLDLLYNGTDVYNLSDIKTESTNGAININGLYFADGFLYVSTDMGITMVNLSKKEISNTYIIGTGGAQTKVYAVAVDAVKIYAATEEGLKYAFRSSGNLQDFNSWTLVGPASGLPAKKMKYVETLNNRVYTVVDGGGTDTIYGFDGTNWLNYYYDSLTALTSFRTFNSVLYFTAFTETGGLNGKIESNGNISSAPTQGHNKPTAWFEVDNMRWEADLYNGLFRDNLHGYVERIAPEGPFSPDVYDIEISNGVVYVCAGSTDDSWGPTFNPYGFFIYKDNKWTYKNIYNDNNLSEVYGVLGSAPVPAKGLTYFGSFLSGLVRYNDNDGSTYVYNKDNSVLEGAQHDPQRTKISAVVTDAESNVWVCNSDALKPLKVIKASDESIRAFTIPYNIEVMKKLVFDDYGQLWAPTRPTGLLVFSDNGTIDDVSDDKSRWLHSGAGNGGLPADDVFCVAKDLDGNIWAGTYQGIAVFYCAGSVLSQSGCDADQIKVVNPDGYVGYLFGTETVRAIAVDAANRKWIGTSNGLWLISADGKDQLLKFNTENSPMPTNQVTDIEIDEKTGEVFIGTTGGLLSYQGDAVAACEDCESALVYPNPVKADYTGPIAIKGLTDQAYVKITDVSGTLIYQGKANGSQMIWDGKNYKGERAHSGVYLVFSSTDLGKEKRVAKILLTN
ncbi:MAG: hypothetical protein U0V74_00365 [Chitinophagales bacterium]